MRRLAWVALGALLASLPALATYLPPGTCDGCSAPANTLSAITGSITHAGRTVTLANVTYGPITAGSSVVATVPITDSKSGAAQVDDWCGAVVASTATMPIGMVQPSCQVKSVGVATITFQGFGVAIVSGTLPIYVHWRG